MTDPNEDVCSNYRARKPDKAMVAPEPAVPNEPSPLATSLIAGLSFEDGDKEHPNFDPARYLEQMADIDISEAEKNELLLILWDIMSRFVELGFGVDSLSLKDELTTTKEER